MDSPTLLLASSAAAIAVLHTAIGVDHTLPFIVLGRARGWSMRRLLVVTALCGLGHVLVSIALAAGGGILGTALERLLAIEAARGELAAWLLVAFGLTYTAWALVRRLRGRTHSHVHAHHDGTVHAHLHAHHAEHLHMHAHKPRARPGPGGVSLSAGALFVVFLLGPCEFMIGPLMAASTYGWVSVSVVALVFGAFTIGTMLVLVSLGAVGLRRGRLSILEGYAHEVAGVGLTATGGALAFLGL